MKKRVIVIILVLALLLDVQRVSAAETGKNETISFYQSIDIML